MNLTDPCDLYTSSFDASKFTNKNDSCGKLQGSEVYGNKLIFILLEHKGQFQTFQVYNSEVNIGTTVKCAYQLGTALPIKVVAQNNQ